MSHPHRATMHEHTPAHVSACACITLSACNACPPPAYVLQLVLDACTITQHTLPVVHAHPPACVWQPVLNAYTITQHALLEMHELSLQLAMHTPLSNG
jgi:hypothetical protein